MKRTSPQDDPLFGRTAIFLVLGMSVFLIALDLLHHKHSHFAWEDLFGFYGLFGAAAAVLAAVAAKLLRSIVRRPEGYYDE